MAHSAVTRLQPRRPRRRAVILLVVIAALLLLAPVLLRLAAEWPWFSALGYQRVFATRLLARLLLGVGIATVACGFLYLNLRLAQRGVVPNPFLVSLDDGKSVVDLTRMLSRLAMPIALGIALLIAFGAAGA